jgi:hypothetical protein
MKRVGPDITLCLPIGGVLVLLHSIRLLSSQTYMRQQEYENPQVYPIEVTEGNVVGVKSYMESLNGRHQMISRALNIRTHLGWTHFTSRQLCLMELFFLRESLPPVQNPIIS